MRLLDAEALIYDNVAALVDFPDESLAPEYAILSHTWEEEEVLFHDIALGPQHEVQLSVASIRALRRRSPVTQPDSDTCDFWSSDDTDPDLSDEDSLESKTSPTGSSQSSDEDASTPLQPSSSHSSNNFSSRLHVPHVKAGWNKVLNTCLQTVRDGLTYVWIDTCCIDKSSSAELSEAINSMYRWYEAAAICYAYLSDCDLSSGLTDAVNVGSRQSTDVKYTSSGSDPCPDVKSHIQSSRWFTRGWTLQELIAPMELHFFDRNWCFISDRTDIVPALEAITGIHGIVLRGRRQSELEVHPNVVPWVGWERSRLSKYSVAQRMHWASKRRTTRKEDEAYCLLGIFGINMPLLYGEGGRAFDRLQEEIIRTSTDQTILAWEPIPGSEEAEDRSRRILAPSPANFWWCTPNIKTAAYGAREIRLTSEGLETDLRLEEFRLKYGYKQIIGLLNVGVLVSQRHLTIGIRLQIRSGVSSPGRRFVTDVYPELASFIEEREGSYQRLLLLPSSDNDWNLPTDRILILHPGSMTLSYEIEPPSLEIKLLFLLLQSSGSEYGGCVPGLGYPRSQWHAAKAKMTLPQQSTAYGAVAMRYRSQEFVVVFGGVTPRSNDIDEEGVPVESLCKCWILKWPFEWKSEPSNYSESLVTYLDLKRLCDRAEQFSSMDNLERSTSRRDCHKWLRFEHAQTARVKVTRGPQLRLSVHPQQYLHLRYETTQVGSPGRVKDSGPLAERDYFQLEELREPAETIPSASQKVIGNPSIKRVRFASP